MDHAELLRILNYDPTTGVFTWKVTRCSRALAGTQAGSARKDYRVVSINGKTYLEHRLAWFYMHGMWPSKDIDHEDRNGLNNAFLNLREATEGQNCRNASKRKNLSGFKGVHPYRDRFLALIRVNYKAIRLGIFTRAEDAAAAYDAAAIQHGGPFAATNKSLGLL